MKQDFAALLVVMMVSSLLSKLASSEEKLIFGGASISMGMREYVVQQPMSVAMAWRDDFGTLHVVEFPWRAKMKTVRSHILIEGGQGK